MIRILLLGGVDSCCYRIDTTSRAPPPKDEYGYAQYVYAHHPRIAAACLQSGELSYAHLRFVERKQSWTRPATVTLTRRSDGAPTADDLRPNQIRLWKFESVTDIPLSTDLANAEN
jgi:hypothetical protein